jgi:hypothetical protein
MRAVAGVTLPVGARYEARPRHFVRYHLGCHAVRQSERRPSFPKLTCALVAVFGARLGSFKSPDSCARGETICETGSFSEQLRLDIKNALPRLLSVLSSQRLTRYHSRLLWTESTAGTKRRYSLGCASGRSA